MYLYVYAFIKHWDVNYINGNGKGKGKGNDGWQGIIRDSMSLNSMSLNSMSLNSMSLNSMSLNSMSLKRSRTHSRCCNSVLQTKVPCLVAAESQ